MKPYLPVCLMVIALCCASLHVSAQEETSDSLTGFVNFPARLFSKIDHKVTRLSNQLDRKTEKYLKRLARSEAKLKRKILRKDSSAAKTLFSFDAAGQYKLLSEKLKTDSVSNRLGSGEYRPYTDSLKMLLSFLDKSKGALSSGVIPASARNTLDKFNRLQAKMQTADIITQFIQLRKEQVKNYLLKYTRLSSGIGSVYKNYSKDFYYYREQVNEYKNILNDPDKMLKTALTVLHKLPVFSAFMRKYSALAGLFPIPGGVDNSAAIGGLSSRDQISSFIQSRSGTSGVGTTSLMQKNIQSAQGQIDQLRNKLSAGQGGDDNLPEFKPNGQKTKSFFKRFEYGTNLQTVKNNYFFPVTTDFGLSLAYKLNDKNSLGVGTSYKLGWGKDIKHIAVSNQGVGFRSFLDINIRKSFFASGGFEYNYQQPFYSSDILYHLESWQQSGLIGISKIVTLNSKIFKKTKIQLLWDFLSYQQLPRAQPFKFRVGYNF